MYVCISTPYNYMHLINKMSTLGRLKPVSIVHNMRNVIVPAETGNLNNPVTKRHEVAHHRCEHKGKHTVPAPHHTL